MLQEESKGGSRVASDWVPYRRRGESAAHPHNRSASSHRAQMHGVAHYPVSEVHCDNLFPKEKCFVFREDSPAPYDFLTDDFPLCRPSTTTQRDVSINTCCKLRIVEHVM